MNQDELKAHLLTLERKVKLLLSEHKSVHEELVFLKNENEALRTELKTREEQVSDFQNKIKITKIVSNIDTEDGEASELKKKIDNYIKEIDKCIAHLSK